MQFVLGQQPVIQLPQLADFIACKRTAGWKDGVDDEQLRNPSALR